METLEKRSDRDQKPVLTGEEGAEIGIRQAAEWTANYRDRYPGETISYFFGQNLIRSILEQEGCVGLRVYYANAKPLNAWQKFFLTVGNFIRNEIGNAEGEKHLIIVGANKCGHDQLPGKEYDENCDGTTRKALSYIREEDQEEEKMSVIASVTGEERQNIIMEQATPCPGSPNCPKNQLTEKPAQQ